jgi:uncharacterized protein YbjQ (UPF0145 family)
MRKMILIVAVLPLLFSSCVTERYTEISSVVDYSKYAKKGFFLSESNSVNFEYEAFGSLSVVVLSGKKQGEGYKVASSDDAVRLLYEKAKDLGVNGLINVKFDYSTVNKRSLVTASGMAIKRRK